MALFCAAFRKDSVIPSDFFTPASADGFSLESDRKSPQTFITLLFILADFNNAVVSWVSILPLIFDSASFFPQPMETVFSMLTIIGITVTLMFHRFLSSLARSKYFSTLLLPFTLNLWSAGTTKLIR